MQRYIYDPYSSFKELSPLADKAVLRIEREESSIRDYTFLIGILPAWLFESYFSWRPSTKDETEGANYYKAQYFFISQWLDYYLGTSRPSEGLFWPQAAFWEPQAEFLKAVKDLASKLITKYPEEFLSEQTGRLPTAADIMLCAAIQKLAANILVSGLVTGMPLHEFTKAEIHDCFEVIFQSLGGNSKRQGRNKIVALSPRLKLLSEEARVPVLDLLTHLGERAIKDDPRFKSDSSLRTFREQARKIGTRLRRDKNVWIDRYDNGVLRSAGRNGKRNPQRVTTDHVTKTLQRSI